MALDAIIKAGNLYSAWELSHNQRRTFTYTGNNITTIALETLKDTKWITVFKQELTYDDSDNLLSITGIKL